MNLFATFRQRRQAAPLLSIVAVAFLGLVATPCAMASSSDVPVAESVHAVSSHNGCPHATSTKPMSEAECCCSVGVALNLAKQEVPKPDPQLSLSVDVQFFSPSIVVRGPDRSHTISVSAKFPPVYLSTQRLRL